MIKYLILSTSSIACVLSNPNIADAKNRISNHQLDRALTTRSNLIVNEPQSSHINAISASDLKDIEQAVIDHYKNLNKEPIYPVASGISRFYEVKNLKIVSFSLFDTRGTARVQIVEAQRTYSFSGREVLDKNNRVIPKKYKYTFAPSQKNSLVRTRDLSIIKNDGKWVAY